MKALINDYEKKIKRIHDGVKAKLHENEAQIQNQKSLIEDLSVKNDILKRELDKVSHKLETAGIDLENQLRHGASL